ncbi:unnamed protein product [Amaranthus hypochondriacus]
MAGAIPILSKNQQQAGSRLFLFSNLTGKYAWPAGYQQVGSSGMVKDSNLKTLLRIQKKNWGAGFPKKWFWIQCNVFEGVTGEVSVTSAGGLRALPGGTIENAALVGVHYEGVFYEFVPWNGDVEWEISPWGYWKVSADNGSYKVELEGRTEDKGVMLKAPTPDTGLIDICRDTCSGQLKLHLWERISDGSKGKVILEAEVVYGSSYFFARFCVLLDPSNSISPEKVEVHGCNYCNRSSRVYHARCGGYLTGREYFHDDI